MSELAALLFDVDGTLADTERDGHRVAFNQAFAQFGLDWHWSEQTYGELLAVTGGKERMLHYVQTHDKAEQQRSDLQQLIKRLHAQKTENYVRLLNDNAIPLRPGIERLLGEARAQGIRLAIATTTTPDNVTALLQNALGAESLDWFEVIGARLPVSQSGEGGLTLFVLHDVTARKRLENVRTEFVANVSHELKTPLSVVRMFADMLRSDRVPSEPTPI